MALPHCDRPPRQDTQKLRCHHHQLCTQRLENPSSCRLPNSSYINWPTPTFFDHVPRSPHKDSIKCMGPALTEDQLQIILQMLLRLNPARPNLTNRTFGRRRRRLHQQLQPLPEPTPVTTEHTTETNFTIGIDYRPQLRPTHSLIASPPFCVCCLCGYNHATPDCPPRAALPTSPHVCQLQTTPEDPTDPPAPLPQAPLSAQE